jgi:hypothetical protein
MGIRKLQGYHSMGTKATHVCTCSANTPRHDRAAQDTDAASTVFEPTCLPTVNLAAALRLANSIQDSMIAALLCILHTPDRESHIMHQDHLAMHVDAEARCEDLAAALARTPLARPEAVRLHTMHPRPPVTTA